MVRRTAARLRLGALADVLRSISAAGLAALVSGVLVGGVGGRLAMRVAALADPDEVGTVTQSGNVIGEMSGSGTAEVIIAAGFTGLVAGLVWALVKPWTEPLGKWRSFFGGILAVATTAFSVVATNNLDFVRLDPPWLNIGIFLVLFFAAGVVLVELDDWLERRLSPPRGVAVAFYLLVAAGLVTVGIIEGPSLFLEEGSPLITGALLGLAGLATIFFWVLTIAQGAQPEPPRWLRALGNIGLYGATIAGLIYLWPQIRDITG